MGTSLETTVSMNTGLILPLSLLLPLVSALDLFNWLNQIQFHVDPVFEPLLVNNGLACRHCSRSTAGLGDKARFGFGSIVTRDPVPCCRNPSKSAGGTCDDCEQFSAGLVSHFTSHASIAEQERKLKETVCTSHTDPVLCEEGVTKWWGQMAGRLYPTFFTGDVCQILGLCKEWTCEFCTDTMEKVRNFLVQKNTADLEVSLLQGDCFCGKPGHSTECGPFMNKFIPEAMMVVSNMLSSTTSHICKEVMKLC